MAAWLHKSDFEDESEYHYSLTPPASVSAETDVVRRIRSEIMPEFVPLWLTRRFKTHAGRVVELVHVCLARYVKHPPQGAYVVKGLPQGPNGEKVKLIEIANGLSSEEVTQGYLGRYVPLQEIYEQIKMAHHLALQEKDIEDETVAHQTDERARRHEKEAHKRKMIDELSYKRLNDRDQLNRAAGHIGRTYVSSTMLKLKKAAGRALRKVVPRKETATNKARGNGVLPLKAQSQA